MGLLDVVDKARNATGGLGEIAEAQIKTWVADFKKSADLLETFGFSVGKFSFGMGALPEVHILLEGSIENIHEDRLRKMIDEHKTNEALVSLLKTLIWLRWAWEHMELKKLTGVTLHVTLGLPPKVSAELH